MVQFQLGKTRPWFPSPSLTSPIALGCKSGKVFPAVWNEFVLNGTKGTIWSTTSSKFGGNGGNWGSWGYWGAAIIIKGKMPITYNQIKLSTFLA